MNEDSANILQVLWMCQTLGELGHEITLAIPRNAITDNKEGCINLVKKKLSIDRLCFSFHLFRRITLFNRFKSIGCLVGAWRILRQKAHDVVFIRVPILLPLINAVGYRHAFEIHYHRYSENFLLNKLVERIVIRSSRRPDMIGFIVISAALKEWWQRKGIPVKKTVVLHDGFSENLFFKPLTRKQARNRLGLPVKQKVVLYVGSLYPDRDISSILWLAEKMHSVRFIILGGPPRERNNYERECKKLLLRNVSFVGYRPQKEVVLYLYAADVLLMLWSDRVKTIHYCSPLKLFEYMASGRIIVGHRYRTIQEVVQHGEHALLVEPNDREGLHAALNYALSLGYPNSIASNARTLAFQEYTWKIRSQTIIDMFSKA